MESWSVGALERWSVGVMELWSGGVLECWSVGVVPVLRSGSLRLRFISYADKTEGLRFESVGISEPRASAAEGAVEPLFEEAVDLFVDGDFLSGARQVFGGRVLLLGGFGLLKIDITFSEQLHLGREAAV